MRKNCSAIRIFVFLFFLCFIAMLQYGFAATATNARELFLPIDASKPGASVSAEIEVRENNLYIFYFDIHYRNEDERKRVFKIVGDGSRLIHGGGYANPGVVFPVHLKLTTSDGKVLLDVTSRVQGIVGHSLGPNLSGEYLREIGESFIKPGLYHVEINILRPVPEFQGFECAIAVGTRPHTR